MSKTEIDFMKFMKKACLLCDRSKCGYKTGCVAIKNGKVLFKAWNESLSGEIFCQSGSCVREKENLKNGKNIDRVCSIHAEASIVAQAAQKGVSLAGCDLYATTFPCLICSRLLSKTKIGRLFYMSDYLGENLGRRLLKSNGVKIIQILEKDVWSESRNEKKESEIKRKSRIKKKIPKKFG